MTLTQKVWDVLLLNERFLNKMEHAFAKRLIKWSSSASSKFDHIAYLEYIQSLNLAKQKAEVSFLVKIFECAGIRLNCFELRHFQNVRKHHVPSKQSPKKKDALALDIEIQASILAYVAFVKTLEGGVVKTLHLTAPL